MEKKLQYKVIVSDRARHMLAGHVRFLAQKSPAAAREVKDNLMAAIRSLHQMPERFPCLLAEFIPPNKYHKMFVEKWYLILSSIRQVTAVFSFVTLLAPRKHQFSS